MEGDTKPITAAGLNEEAKAIEQIFAPDKRPVKVRLAEKHARNRHEAVRAHAQWMNENEPGSSRGVVPLEDELRDAYLAGFERGKALAVDYVMRFVNGLQPENCDGPKVAETMRKLVGEG